MNYEKIYNSIIKNRKLNAPIGYVEEHHIVPRSIGGTNEKSNLVCLTAKEHFICHLLLTKMYKYGTLEYYKMCHAFLMMLVHSTSHDGNRYISSRKYEQLKVSFSERMSIIQMGEGNSQYGTMWIHNKTLKQSKKVANDAIIDDGWERGRVLNWNKIPRAYVSCKKEKLPKETSTKKYFCLTCGCERKITAKYCSRKCWPKRKPSLTPPPSTKGIGKKCICDGIKFDTLTYASIHFGISVEGIRYRLNTEKYVDWYYEES